MTLTRSGPLKRRAGLTARAGIVRRAGLPRASRQAATLGAVAPSPRRERKAHLDVPSATRELLRARSGGRCEAEVALAGCTRDATDVHHRKRRRDGGHAITNLVDLCRACHRWAHHNPAQARDLGLIVSAYEEPATVPVLLRSRLIAERIPVLLLPDGSYLAEVAP